MLNTPHQVASSEPSRCPARCRPAQPHSPRPSRPTDSAEKLEKDAPTLSEAERGRRSRDIGEKDRDLQRKKREWQEDLTQRRNEELAAVVEKANKVIKQIAETEKYDLIIQEAVYRSTRIDITEKVIKALAADK